MDRLFLDANILFSAAYRADAGLLRLWTLPDVELVASAYAEAEARINLDPGDQHARLDRLMASVEVVPQFRAGRCPKGVDLPSKDRTILLAALEARAPHLLTGDKDHFGKYFGRVVEGVLILLPGTYLRGLPPRVVLKPPA